MRRTTLAVILGLSCSQLCAQAPGDAAAEIRPDSIPVETFSPPVRTKTRSPTYPRSYQRSGREGWVNLNFMIDPNGKPYDVTVHDSSGDRLFEESAIRAVRGFRYDAAEFNGRHIDAGSAVTITFALSGETGARAPFVRAFKNFSAALTAGDQTRASDVLAELEARDRNLYEEAFFHLARYQYAKRWGDTSTQYAAIRRAAFFDRGQEFLPVKTLTSVLSTKLNLELQLNKLAYARQTARQLLQRDISPDFVTELEALLQSIDQVASSGQTLAVAGVIRSDNRYAHKLLKSTFTLTDIDGDVAELRLHCDKGYVGFMYSNDLTYRVNASWQDCTVIVIGDPGTTFNLTET